MMVKPMLRSRSKTQKRLKTPGGKSKTHYKKTEKTERKCRICGKPLHGIERSSTKSKKRPSRIMPDLCPKCMRKEMVSRVRGGL